MPSIEEDVVKINIDKSGLEKGTNESISLLDKLKNALNFDSSIRSLKNLQNSTQTIDLSGIENAVEQVTSKFSVLEVAARRTVERVVDRLENFAVRELKSLSIDNVTAGWSKYADKTTAVQTIMAATANQFSDTGEQMEYVEEQLERLSWFTDETSYKFVDMVQNIGKFTSNGIKLESAVTAMQGISTWAALSGAGTEQAGRAMYNLSQAIGAGKVMAIDWRSIENANMATEQFKEIVLEAAAARKILTKTTEGYVTADKKATVTTKNFTQTLQKGWFTSEVLVDSLNKFGTAAGLLRDFTDMTDLSAATALKVVDQYKEGVLDINQLAKDTGASASDLQNILRQLGSAENELGLRAFRAAQETKTLKEATDYVKEAVSSGWMVSFEQIFGNYEESKKLWSNLSEELYNIFVVGGERRNALLKAWHAAGGYDMLWEGVGNLWQALKNVAAPIKQAWEMIFPPLTSNRLLEWTKAFRDWSEGFKHAFDWSGNLKDIIPEPLANLFETLFPELKEDVKAPAEEVKTELSEIADANEEMVQRILNTQPKLDEYAREAMRGNWSVNPKRFQMMEEAGLYPEMIQNRVNELMGNGYRYALDEEAIAEANRRLAGEYKETAADVKKAAEKAAAANQEAKNAAEEAVDTDKIKTRVDKLGEIFLGLFELLRDISDLIEGIDKFGWEVAKHVVEKMQPIGDAALDIMAGFSTDFTQDSIEFRQSGQLEKYFSELTETVNHSTDILSESIGNIWTNVSNSEGFADFSKSIETLGTNLGTLVETLSGSISNLLKNVDLEEIGEGLTVIFSALGDFSFEAASKVVEFFSGLAKALTETWTALSDSEELDRLSTLLEGAWAKISEFASEKFAKVREALDKIDFGSIAEGLSGLFTALGKFSFEKTGNLIEFFGDLGTSIGNFWEQLTSGPGFEHFKKSFGEFSKVISESVVSGLASAGEFIGGIDFGKAGNDISTVFAGLADIAFDKIAAGLDWIVSKKDQIKEFFSLFSTKLAGAIEAVASAFDHFADATTSASSTGLGKLNEYFGGFVSTIWSLFYNSKNILVMFKEKLGAAMDTVSDVIAKFDINAAFKTFKNGAAGALLLSLAGFLSSISKAIYSLGQVPLKFAKVLNKLGECLSEYTYLIRAEALLKIAQAIGIFVIALIGLSYVNPDNLDHATASIVAVLLVLSLLIRTIGNLISFSPKNITGPIEDIMTAVKDFGTKLVQGVAKMAGLAMFFIGLSALLITITYVIKEFIEVPWDKLGHGLAVVGLFSLMIVTLVGVLAMVQERVGDASKLGTTMLGIAVTIIAIAAAVKILSGIKDADTMTVAAIVIGVLFGIIVFAVERLKKIETGSLLAMAGSFVIFAAAIAMMAVPLGLLAMQDWNSIKKIGAAVVIIGAIIAALTGAAVVLSKKQASAKSLLAVAAAVYILSEALTVLSNVGKEENIYGALNGIIALGLLAAIFVGMVVVLDHFKDSLERIAPSMLMFSLGLLAAAAAVYVLAAAMPLIVDGLIALGKGIQDHGQELLTALIAVILLVIAAFTAKVVLAKIGSSISFIKDWIFSRLAKGVDIKSKMLAVGALLSLIGFVVGTLKAIMPDLIDGLVTLITSAIQALAEAITNNAGPLLDAIFNLGRAIIVLLLEAVAEILDIFGENNLLSSGIRDWADSIRNDVMTQKPRVENAFATTASAGYQNGIGTFKKTALADATIANTLGAKIDEAKVVAVEKSEEVGEESAEALLEENTEVMQKGDMAKGFMDNIAQGNPVLQKYLEDNFGNLGGHSMEAFSEGQTEELGEAQEELDASTSGLAATTEVNTKPTFTGSGKGSGKYWTLGFKSGVEENAEMAIGAVIAFAGQVNSAARSEKAFDEASPSKVSEKIGMFYAEGLANGIEKNTGVATKATETMAGKVIASLRNTSSEINSYFDSGINLNPTISPVLDLSNLQNGMNNVNGLFSSTSYALSGSVSNIRSPQDLMNMRMEHMFQAKLDDVASKLASADSNRAYEFTIPVEIDGRQVARSTAVYTNEELDRINRRNNRKAGIV